MSSGGNKEIFDRLSIPPDKSMEASLSAARVTNGHVPHDPGGGGTGAWRNKIARPPQAGGGRGKAAVTPSGRGKLGSKNLINEEGFQNALYMMDIGQNDLAGISNMSYDQVGMRISFTLSEIENAIKTLYGTGAKSFWIHNTGPLGCLPQKLSLPRKDDSDLDPYGCLMSLNNAAKKFNDGLSALCDELTSQLKNVTIVYTDIYAIKYDAIVNSTNYGFENPLTVCCGYGGPPYNYNLNITCGVPGFQVFPVGSRYISWDGVHYTEAANTIVASKILSMNYSKPSLRFDYFCNP